MNTQKLRAYLQNSSFNISKLIKQAGLSINVNSVNAWIKDESHYLAEENIKKLYDFLIENYGYKPDTNLFLIAEKCINQIDETRNKFVNVQNYERNLSPEESAFLNALDLAHDVLITTDYILNNPNAYYYRDSDPDFKFGGILGKNKDLVKDLLDKL